MPETVLVSTDIGTDLDDALALVLLAQHPDRFDLRGVYTAAGPVELRARIAKKLLDYLGASTPVGVGESKPLDDDPPILYHTATGFEPLLLTKKEQKHVSRSGVRILPDGLSHLEKQIADAHEPVTLISLAPLTNIARLLQRFPSAPQHVRQLYVMGGNTLPESPEHNFLNDIEAARVVFSSSFQVTLIPYDACKGYVIPLNLFALADRSNNLRTYIAHMARIWRLHNELIALSDRITPITASSRVSPEIKDFQELALDRRKYLNNYRAASFFYKLFKARFRSPSSMVETLFKMAIREAEQQSAVTVPCDAYVAYALLHPERVESRRATVTIEGMNGYTLLAPGDKHSVVTRFDYAHAGSFFEQHFRGHPKVF